MFRFSVCVVGRTEGVLIYWGRIRGVALLGSCRRPLRAMEAGCIVAIKRFAMRIVCVSNRRYGLFAVVVLLCFCVLAQMLGMPVTMLALVTSADILMESVSEDFSLTPVMPEPGTSGSSSVHAVGQPAVHLPVFVTSVFHPPQI